MSNKPYLTAPVPSKDLPGGIPYIVGNEAAERFSYYGMKAILIVFMTKYLLDSEGAYAVMSEEDAKYWYHLFGTAVYFTPILGAIIADAFFGKYKTIMTLSVVYCLGHLALAIDETRIGLAIGLTLIAIGSGGIKPCVSAHVGDQFGRSNAHLIEKIFGWFYFSINLGAFASTLLTPYLLDAVGPSLAFGIPGLLMLIATIVFWLGRHKFVHIPAHGLDFVKEAISGEGLKALGKLVILYAFVAMFWALFDQTGSAWVLQADRMDLEFAGITWLPSQIQAINPIMIMVFIPIFTYVIYPGINRLFTLTPLRKIAIGFFVTVPAFMLPAWIQVRIEAGDEPNIVWQLLAYAIITAAEVFVSITALEFSYTQAPKKMKSLIMGLFLMSVSMGNLFTAVVNLVIQDEALVAEVDTTGEREVPIEKTTTYALQCSAEGGEPAEATVGVEVIVPPKTKASDADANKPSIESFTANGATDRVVVEPGTAVELSWASKNTENCVVRPPGADVETTGKTTVSPEATTTYALECEGTDDSAEQRLTVVVTRGAAITSFTVNGAGSALVPPPGGNVNLAWSSTNADKCRILARTNTLSGPGYYMFFAGAMLLTALLFLFVSMKLKTRTYIQDEEEVDTAAGEQSSKIDEPEDS